MTQQSLTGKVIVVTGASRGIGRAMCEALGKRGARVAAAARTLAPGKTTRESLVETVAQVAHAGGEGLAHSVDVRDAEQVKGLFSAVLERWGRLDVLVNNAGLMIGERSFQDTDPALWRQVIETNLSGAYHCAWEAAAAMVSRGSGIIINVTSGAAVRTGFLNQAYGVSKAGLDRLTLGLAEELREWGVACVSLSPSVTDTATVRAMYPDKDITRFASPVEAPAEALCALLEDPDPMRYSGRVVTVRELLE